MEIADIILVNKADGDLEAAATRTCADYAGALRLLRARPGDGEGFPKATTVSAMTGKGLDAAWRESQSLISFRGDSGFFEERRANQARDWFEAEVQIGLLARLSSDPMIRQKMALLGDDVAAGKVSAMAAARAMLADLA